MAIEVVVPVVCEACRSIEKLWIPAVSIHTEKFAEYLKYDVAREGQPLQRMVFVPHPLAGEPSTAFKQYVNGKDPTTGKPVMQEIIDALTKPLSVVETKTGISETKRVRLLEQILRITPGNYLIKMDGLMDCRLCFQRKIKWLRCLQEPIVVLMKLWVRCFGVIQWSRLQSMQ